MQPMSASTPSDPDAASPSPPRRASWPPLAAYLYVLHLDDASMAWEYLRRNRVYQQDWQSLAHGLEQETAQSWGLRLMEDPGRDAREVQPHWLGDPQGLVHLKTDEDPLPDAPAFCLWQTPGRKRLTHEGKHVLLTSQLPTGVLRLALSPQLGTGMAYSPALRAGPAAAARWAGAQPTLALLERTEQPAGTTASRPASSTLLNMRTLQAIDGKLAGASQREIAEVLFGLEAVGQHWGADSELRAQIRRWLRRADTFIEGGYRQLIASKLR
jgi:hypothetical protein